MIDVSHSCSYIHTGESWRTGRFVLSSVKYRLSSNDVLADARPYDSYRAPKSRLRYPTGKDKRGVRPVSERGSNKTEAVKEDIARRRKKRKDDWKRRKEKNHVVFFGAEPLDTAGAVLARERLFCGPSVVSPLSFFCTSTTRPSVSAVVVLR